MKGHLPPFNPHHTTRARLEFVSPLAKSLVEKPYFNASSQTNLEFVSEVVLIQDIRGSEQETDFERNKFEFLRLKSSVQFTPGSREAEVEKVDAYLLETVAWVKERLQPEFCIAYSYTVCDHHVLLIVPRSFANILIHRHGKSFVKHQQRQIPLQ
jgi:lipid A disaccharide synthetase